MTQRIQLIALTCLSAACSRVDQHQSTPADSADKSLVTAATASSTETRSSQPNAVKDSSARQDNGIAATEVAHWRGSAIVDQIDTLIAAALNTKGEFTGDSEMYEFSGSENSFEKLSKLPSAVPRLVDCLGWDQRAAATFKGARVLVGVICDQVLIRNPNIQERLTTLGPNGYPNPGIDYRNPSINQMRKGQLEWRKLLLNQPM
ncbi:MAG: hypothetical protein M3P12_15635 [Gemmatimonadota bacterium]|nr:hypothetical protein [Gemmatimonadota bacterium]